MQNDPLTEWYIHRLENYSQKLNISKKKARKRLELFSNIEQLRQEFDRIVDSKFWSSKEPAISYEERKKRLSAMHKSCAPKATQLSLIF